MLAGLSVLIGAVNSNTSITLARAWPGAAQTGANYDIMLLDDNVRSLVAANQLLQELQNGNISALAGLSGAADKVPYFTGAGAMTVSDLTPAARAILALAGSSGAKIPVVTAAGTAAMRSILGTVSQSGGVPTGALIERGSNANGEYVRLADGTQICTHILTLNNVAASNLSATWTYPAAFSALQVVSAAPDMNSVNSAAPGLTGVGQCAPSNETATSATIALYRITGLPDFVAGNSAAARCLAVGRWF
jgi:hypothetical protein